jgi:hypothetical protein
LFALIGMKPHYSEFPTLIRKLVRRANENKDESLFSILLMLEQEVEMWRSPSPRLIAKAKGINLSDRRRATVGSLSRYVE